MLAFPVVASLMTKGYPEIAYSARYYYPAGVAKTSYHQVYLSDLHGGHRRQLTSDAREKFDVHWLTYNRLAWVQTKGISNSETWLGSHVPMVKGSDSVPLPMELIEFDITTGKKQIVDSGQFRFTPDPEAKAQRVYKYKESFDPPHNALIETFQASYEVVKGHLRKCLKSNKAEFDQLGFKASEDIFSLLGQGFISEEVQVPMIYVGRDRREGTGMQTQLKRNGRVYKLPFSMFDKAWLSPDERRVYFRYTSHAGSAGNTGYAWKLDLFSGISKLIANEVQEVEFDSNRRFWVGRGNNKETRKLGRIQVWTTDIHAGDSRISEQWKVTDGAVHADSVALRPGSYK